MQLSQQCWRKISLGCGVVSETCWKRNDQEEKKWPQVVLSFIMSTPLMICRSLFIFFSHFCSFFFLSLLYIFWDKRLYLKRLLFHNTSDQDFLFHVSFSHVGRERSTNLHYTSQRPDVHLVAVSFLAQHFRCNVVGGAAQCPGQTNHRKHDKQNTNTTTQGRYRMKIKKPQCTLSVYAIFFFCCIQFLLAALHPQSRWGLKVRCLPEACDRSPVWCEEGMPMGDVAQW